jgi:RNA polymerase sigma-70 factor (ECF subfamily)
MAGGFIPQLFAQPRVPGGVYASAESLALDPDAVLMRQVREGNETSFAQLLSRNRTPLVHFLYRMVDNQAVAEELAQEVFLRVYRSRDRYEPTAKFTTWLFRIATRIALNWLRDGKRERGQSSLDDGPLEDESRQVADPSPTAESALLREAKCEAVRKAIAALPAKQRAAVVMHKYQELEYSQIAEALGCTESALKSMLFRAYETLRGRLAQYA